MKARFIINAAAGTVMSVGSDRIIKTVRETAGEQAEIVLVEPGNMVAAMQEAFGDAQIDAVIVGGGDGTASLAGRMALANGKVLGVLPFGTMNLLARSIGTPLDFTEACTALAAGTVRRLDVGEANGVPFLTHVSLGLHPRIIRLRDRLPRSGRITKMLNGLIAAARAMRLTRRYQLTFSGDFETFETSAVQVYVTVNPVAVSGAPETGSQAPHAGKLGCYVLPHLLMREAAGLLVALWDRRLDDNETIEFRSTTRLRIDYRRDLHASIDGEVRRMKFPLEIRIRPQALSVLVPPEPG